MVLICFFVVFFVFFFVVVCFFFFFFFLLNLTYFVNRIYCSFSDSFPKFHLGFDVTGFWSFNDYDYCLLRLCSYAQLPFIEVVLLQSNLVLWAL